MSVGSRLMGIGRMMIAPFLRIPSPYRIAGGGIALLLVVLIMAVIMSGGRGWLAGALLFIIVAVVIALVLFLLNRYLAWRASKRAMALGGALSQEHEKEVAVSSEARQQQLAEIKTRWDQAIHELKRANLSLYQLPWILLIGEPQSGKSTTIKNSGLEFPVGSDKLSGAGGTRNCDWWFTNHAIILDTAGRYAFNQSDAPDSSEWSEFLRLMKRHRPSCPINGVILAIPATALLGESREEREAKAKRLRQKLEEVQALLEIQFPVFVLVTKADRLLGFTEFFLQLPAMEQRQLFGWSRPGEYSRAFEVEEFDQGFAQMSRDLRRWRLRLLEEDLPAQQRDRLFALPDEFDTLEAPLRDYLGEIFKSNVFSEPLYLRGIYFTSGLQKGRPIVKACAQLVSGASHGPDEMDLSEIFEKPRTFFVRDFYRRKVFPEAGLVNPSSQSVKRQAFLGKVVYGLGGTTAALVLLISVFGFFSGGDRYSTLQEALESIGRFKNEREASVDRAATFDKALLRTTRLGKALEQLADPGVTESLFRMLVVSDSSLRENVEETFEGFVLDELATPFLDDTVAALGRGDLATTQPLAYQRALRTTLRLAAASTGASTDGDPWAIDTLIHYANARKQAPELANNRPITIPLDDKSEELWGFSTAWQRMVSDPTETGSALHEEPRQRLSSSLTSSLGMVSTNLRQIVQQTWQRVLDADLTFPYDQWDELLSPGSGDKKAVAIHGLHRQLAAAQFLDRGIAAIPTADASWEASRPGWAVWPGLVEKLGWSFESAQQILMGVGGPLPEPAPILEGWNEIVDRYLGSVLPSPNDEGVLASLRQDVQRDLATRLQAMGDEARGLAAPSKITAFCPSTGLAAPNVGERMLQIRPAIQALVDCLPRDWLANTAVLDRPTEKGLTPFEAVSGQLGARLQSLSRTPDVAKLDDVETTDPLRLPLQQAYERFVTFSEASPRAMARAALPIVAGLNLAALEPEQVDWAAFEPKALEYSSEAVASLRVRVARWFTQLALLQAQAELPAQKAALTSIEARLREISQSYAERMEASWLAPLAAAAEKLASFDQVKSWPDYRRTANGQPPQDWENAARRALSDLSINVRASFPREGRVPESPLDAALTELEAFVTQGTEYLDQTIVPSITAWKETIAKLDYSEGGLQQANAPQVVDNLQTKGPEAILAAFSLKPLPALANRNQVALRSLHAPVQKTFQAGLTHLKQLVGAAFVTEWDKLGQTHAPRLDAYPLKLDARNETPISKENLRDFLHPLDGALKKLLVRYKGLYPAELGQKLAKIYGEDSLQAAPYLESVVLTESSINDDRHNFIVRSAMIGKVLFGGSGTGTDVKVTIKWFPKELSQVDLLFEARSQDGGYLYSWYEIIGMRPADDSSTGLKMRWVEANRNETTEALWSVDTLSSIRIVSSDSGAIEPELFESTDKWSLLDLIYRPQHNAEITETEIRLKIPVKRNDRTFYFTLTLTGLPAPYPRFLPEFNDAGWKK